jgi:hypothetical protein
MMGLIPVGIPRMGKPFSYRRLSYFLPPCGWLAGGNTLRESVHVAATTQCRKAPGNAGVAISSFLEVRSLSHDARCTNV